MSWYRNHGSDRFTIFNNVRDIPSGVPAAA
jgi:hypothetical protein